MNRKANVDYAIIFLAFILILVLLVTYATTQQSDTANIDSLIPELNVHPTHLDWGTIRNGTSAYRNVDLTNTGNATINKLSFTDTCTVGTLAWNLTETQQLPPNTTITSRFTLHTTPNASKGNFNFTITVTGVTN